jgi:transcriptional regulator with XRE-family HTH domain
MEGPMSDAELDVGTRLKELRTERGLSQRALAGLAGITAGALSQMENGLTSPSVSTLKRILSALGVSMAAFFSECEEPHQESTFIYRSASLHDISPVEGIRYMALPGDADERTIQLMHEHYAVGASTGDEHYRHEGEECGIVLEGSFEVTVAGVRGILGPGDVYYFASDQPHGFKNVGSKPVRLVTACTPGF